MKCLLCFIFIIFLCSCSITSNEIRGDIVTDFEKTTPQESQNTTTDKGSIYQEDVVFDYPDAVGFIQQHNGEIFDGQDEFSPFISQLLQSLKDKNSKHLSLYFPAEELIEFTQSDSISKVFATRFTIPDTQKNAPNPTEQAKALYAVSVCHYDGECDLWFLEADTDSNGNFYVSVFRKVNQT